MYRQETVYVVGEAKSPENNPITKQYSTFFVGLVIDRSSGEIVDADCTAMIDTTRSFVQALFIGKKINDSDTITNEINERYLGSSQKALIVAYKNAQKKYEQSLEK